MTDTPRLEYRAAELRRVFDLSFAQPPPQASEDVEDLLMIRVAGDPYAIRLRDIAGIAAARAIVSLPSAAPDFLGLTGIRGDIIPVFGLSSILGYGHDANSASWTVACGAPETIALGFSELDGFVRLSKARLHADQRREGARQYVHEIASSDTGDRPVIALALVVATIRNRPRRVPPKKEQ